MAVNGTGMAWPRLKRHLENAAHALRNEMPALHVSVDTARKLGELTTAGARMRVGMVVGGENTHSISGFMRNVSSRDLVLTIVKAMSSRQDLTVEVAFAGKREMRVYNRYTAILRGIVYVMSAGRRVCPVRFIPTGIPVTPRDIDRGFSGVAPGSTGARIVVMTDVYAGLGPGVPYTPASLRIVFPTGRHFFHLRHSFVGAAGRSGEAIWVKRNDKVWWRADSGEEPYVHPAQDWETSSGTDRAANLSWAMAFHKNFKDGTHGNCCIHLVVGQAPIDDGRRLDNARYRWETVRIADGSLMSRLKSAAVNYVAGKTGLIRPRVPGTPQPILVPYKFAQSIRGNYRTGSVTATLDDCLTRKAAKATSEDDLLKELIEANPVLEGVPVFQEEYHKLLGDWAYESVLDIRVADAEKYAALARPAASVNEISRSFGKTVETDPVADYARGMLKACFQLTPSLVAWAMWRKTLGTRTATAVILMPLIEEAFKRWVGDRTIGRRGAGMLFGILESRLKGHSFKQTLYAVWMHTLLTEVPFEDACFAHSMFNWAAVLHPDIPFLSAFRNVTTALLLLIGGALMLWIKRTKSEEVPTLCLVDNHLKDIEDLPEVCQKPGGCGGLESQALWDEEMEKVISLEEDGRDLRDPHLAEMLVVPAEGVLTDNYVGPVDTLRPLPEWGLHDRCGRTLTSNRYSQRGLEKLYRERCDTGQFKSSSGTGYWELCHLGVPMCRFTSSFQNILGVVAHKKFFETELTAEQQSIAFRPVTQYFRQHLLPRFEPITDLGRKMFEDLAWEHALSTNSGPAHKERREAEPHLWGNVVQAREVVRNLKLHVKTDEVLIKGSPHKVTGRPIDDCTLEATHGLMPWIYCLAGDLYRQWNRIGDEDPPLELDHPNPEFGKVAWYLRAVKSFDTLAWSTEVENFSRSVEAREGQTHVLLYVAGDDMYSCLKLGNGNKTALFISDLSKCDQSMNNGPLELQYLFYSRVAGECQEMLDAIQFSREMNGMVQKIRTDKTVGGMQLVRCKEHQACARHHRYVRLTGEELTSIGNGLGTGTCTIWSFMQSMNPLDDQQFKRTGAAIGFTIKPFSVVGSDLQDCLNIKPVDFLKGWQIPNHAGQEIWTMLPSRWVKLFKVGTDPTVIYKSRRKRPTMAQAVNDYLVDLRCSVPLFLDWFSYQIWKRLPRVRRTTKRAGEFDLGYFHKFERTTQPRICGDKDATLWRMQQRYAITEHEIMCLFEAMDRCDTLGLSVFPSPVWHKLVAVDYR